MQYKLEKIDPNHFGKIGIVILILSAHVFALIMWHTQIVMSSVAVDYHLLIPILYITLGSAGVIAVIVTLYVIAVVFDKYDKYLCWHNKYFYPIMKEYTNSFFSILIVNISMAAICLREILLKFNAYNFSVYILINVFILILPYFMFVSLVTVYNNIVEFDNRKNEYGFSQITSRSKRFVVMIKIFRDINKAR